MMKRLILTLLFLCIASNAYARYVSVTWDAATGTTGDVTYTLYWGPTSGGAYDYELEVGDVTEYQLAINEESTYMVVTVTDDTGESGYSDEIVFNATTAIIMSTGLSGSGVSLQ